MRRLGRKGWRTSSCGSPAITRLAQWSRSSMPEAARVQPPPADGDASRDALALVTSLPRVPLLHLLRPKWLTARVRARGGERGRGARIALLGITGTLFWAFVLVVVFRLLLYFRRVPDI